MEGSKMGTWLSILIFVISSATLFSAQSPRNVVILSFTTRSPITLHEPVVVDCRLKNEGTQTIVADFGFLKQGEMGTARFAVTGPNGKEMEVTPSEASIFIHQPIEIEKGESFHRQYILDEWHKFAEPGTYKLKIWFSTNIVTRTGDPVEVQRETVLTVRILPPDSTKLVHRCEELLEQVRAIRKKNERFPTEIAQIMSYMNDPVCIPCVQSLYQEAEDVEATDGLRRIGTDEAFEAMILGTQSKDKEAANYARGILERQLPKISNARVRNEILSAIK
jgi:hypothetical protein